MRALVYHGPEDLRLDSVSDPSPETGEVVVAVIGCGVCGSDLHGYRGHSTARIPPLILGHEITGEVVATGPGVDGDLEGAAVCVRPTLSCGHCPACLKGRDNLCEERRLLGMNSPGGLAEFVCVPARNVVKVGRLDPALAMVEVIANARHAWRTVPSCQSVGIAGAGCIGLALLLLAVDAKIPQRLVSEPVRSRRLAAERLGATATTDPAECPLAGLAGVLPARGVDVGFDAVGSSVSRRDAVEATVSGGRVVMLGLADERSELNFADIVRREVELVGSFAYTTADFQSAIGLYERYESDLCQFIHTEPLERGPELFAALADSSDERVKVVLTP